MFWLDTAVGRLIATTRYPLPHNELRCRLQGVRAMQLEIRDTGRPTT